MVKKLEDETFGVDVQAVEEQRNVVTQYYPKVHSMIRYISNRGVDDPVTGERSVWTVDAEVSAWIEQGYSLFNTHYLGISSGETPGQGFNSFGVMYVLVKD